MAGSVVAFRLVQSHAALRLGAIAWVLQAVPLWLLVITPGPAVAFAALALSGVGNGVRGRPSSGSPRTESRSACARRR